MKMLWNIYALYLFGFCDDLIKYCKLLGVITKLSQVHLSLMKFWGHFQMMSAWNDVHSLEIILKNLNYKKVKI